MNIIKSNEGNELIKKNIISGNPFIATKLGGVEQGIISCKENNNYDPIRRMASDNAGITPSDNNTLDYFYNLYVNGISNSDIIGAMGLTNEQSIISKYSKNCVYSELRYLEPFYFDNPWSFELKDKNVLVIHPFENTIIEQYKNREFLFENKNILPKFNLKTIRAEQTNGGGRHNNKSFIESTGIMMEKINNVDFDVALIGCGAYGLILSNHVKKLNKQAIHIGGGLQILFGIKGRRWDVHPEISQLYNDSWVRPSNNEKTLNIDVVEGGTYW